MFDRASLISRRTILGLACVGIAAAMVVAGVFAFAGKPNFGPVNINAEQIAIRGYDTVAYFTESAAVKGQPEFEHEWQGARWHFVSATNRDLFAANPDRYAPKYGGYCSMGLALGEYSDADPELWTIVEGQLYLNKADWVQDMWRKAPEAYIVASEVNWKKHRDELRVNESLR